MRRRFPATKDDAAPPLRILLVDDDEDDAILIGAMLREIDDFRVQLDWERSYEAALRRVAGERHDAYLVDYRIGPESGVEWVREARAHGLRAPVVVLTGQGSHQVDLDAMAAGAADYLVKAHLDSAQLGRVLRYALDRARYRAALEESEARYRELFTHVPVPMWAFDRESLRFVAVNDAAVESYGYTREEFLAMSVVDIRPEDTKRAFRDHVKERRSGLCTGEVWKHVRKDGSIVDVEIAAHDTEIAGRPCRIVVARDVTEELRNAAHLHLLARAFESSTSGMAIIEIGASERPIVYVNPALLAMTGYAQDEVVGRNSAFLLDEGEADTVAEFRTAIADHAEREAVMRCRRKDGSRFWAQVTLAPVRAGEAVTHYIVVASDLTEQRRQEAELAYLARHDPVTGLLRFVGPDEAIQPMLEAAGDDEQVAVFHIDIDHFQIVNDSVGYRGGDETLHLIAQRLRYIAGERGRLWRAGGDEFMMAVPCRPPEDDPSKIAETIREWIEMPVELPSGKLYLSGSIGVALYPIHAETAGDLVQCTDAALRRAKRSGRNATLSFADGYMDEVRDRIALHGRLRHAIGSDELRLHYQPQVRALDGLVIGMEALVRWQTPDRGMVSPARFVPLAEDLGLAVELGRWVLQEACAQARRWHDSGFENCRVAINVSALQLHRTSFLDEVCEAIDRAGIPARMLELELTETAIVDNVERAAEILRGLRDLGVHLALDDFGMGYSCLSQLYRFPIDKLKIDKSFVESVAQDTMGGAITRAIIAMAHELHMKVLAEGVETRAQLGYLARNHCDEFQGYLFGAPVPAAEATELLRRRYVERSLFDVARPGRELLLVDDEENVLRALTRVLRRDGYTIHTATNAAQGFEILARNRVQVIVSDQRMPGVNGTEFLSQVKEMYPDTVRIILSGYTDLATVTDGINRGAIYKFLTKPWNDDELREQVGEAFRRQAATST